MPRSALRDPAEKRSRLLPASCLGVFCDDDCCTVLVLSSRLLPASCLGVVCDDNCCTVLVLSSCRIVWRGFFIF